MKMAESSKVGLISDAPRIQRVWNRELAVVMTIMCLMFSCGITTAVEDARLKKIRDRGVLNLLKLCHTIIPLPAMFLIFFLSDYTGRKPMIIFLFLLTIFTSILHSISFQDTWLVLVFVIRDVLETGKIYMTFVGIWEYSSRKNSTIYPLANAGVWQMSEYLRKMVSDGNMLENDPLYIKVIPVLLGLVCVGWILQWPESPNWLASKGKTEESRAAFLWLHGEEELQSEEERIQASQASDEPKLHKLSLLITIITMTLYKTVVWYKSYAAINTSTNFISNEFKTGLLVCTTIFVVCCTAVTVNKQKIGFLPILGLIAVFIVFGYLAGPIVLTLRTVGGHPIIVHVLYTAYDFINNCGPILMCMVVLVKVVPRDYRAFAYAFSSYFQLGLSAMVLIFAIIVSYD